MSGRVDPHPQMSLGDSRTARQASVWRDSAMGPGRAAPAGGQRLARCNGSTLTGSPCLCGRMCCARNLAGVSSASDCLYSQPTPAALFLLQSNYAAPSVCNMHSSVFRPSHSGQILPRKKQQQKYKEADLRNPDSCLYFDPLIIPWFTC